MKDSLQTNRLKEKKRNQKIIILLLILLLILIIYIVSFDFIPNVKQASYGKGFFDGQVSVVNTINSNLEIPIIIGQGNNTNVKWYSLKEVCENEREN